MEPTYMKLELGRWGAQRDEGEEESDKGEEEQEEWLLKRRERGKQTQG